mgnify:CR=1 FL=1
MKIIQPEFITDSIFSLIDEAKEQAATIKADLVKKAEAEAAAIREKANADAALTIFNQ